MIQPKNKRGPGNPDWGGARKESKLIQKHAAQWFKDNVDPLLKRRYIYKGNIKR